LEGKKYFKCHDYGYFQPNYPNQRTLTIREVKEIQPIEEDDSEEEFKEEDHTLITPNVGVLLVIQKALYTKEVPLEPSQR